MEGGELVSYQESSPEVVVAVVAMYVENVGHPAGGRLWQDGSDKGEAFLLCCRATEEELGLSNPKPGGGAGCPEVRQLEEVRRMPWGAQQQPARRQRRPRTRS